jgi:hypothetical protein
MPAAFGLDSGSSLFALWEDGFPKIVVKKNRTQAAFFDFSFSVYAKGRWDFHTREQSSYPR